MPYTSDTRAYYFKVEFQIEHIWEMLEEITKDEIDNDFDLTDYVRDLEKLYENHLSEGEKDYLYHIEYPKFIDFFKANYNIPFSWDNIKWVEDELCVGGTDGKCVGKKILYKTSELDLGMCDACYDAMENE